MKINNLLSSTTSQQNFLCQSHIKFYPFWDTICEWTFGHHVYEPRRSTKTTDDKFIFDKYEYYEINGNVIDTYVVQRLFIDINKPKD